MYRSKEVWRFHDRIGKRLSAPRNTHTYMVKETNYLFCDIETEPGMWLLLGGGCGKGIEFNQTWLPTSVLPLIGDVT